MSDVNASPSAPSSEEAIPAQAEGFDPAAEADRLRGEVADLKEKLLRQLADMENLRRRTEREVKDARTYAVTGFAREMLGVADNLRRAVEAAAGAGVEGAVLEGVELTERTLLQALERHGVKPIEAEGARFDPHLHQAMYEVEVASAPHGTVVQVLQQGFAIGERVLRPALVGVSKGGPKPAASASATVPDGEGEAAQAHGASDPAAAPGASPQAEAASEEAARG